MTFEEITYSESIETVNGFGTKKWFKSGTKITDINGEVHRATQLAKEYVSDTIKASLLANPSYIADPTTFTSKTNYTEPPILSLPEIQRIQDLSDMSLDEQIASCKDLQVLKSYSIIVKGNQKLADIYANTMIELKRKQPIS